MVPGYMGISDIWSVLEWDGFSYSKKYWIYGQISDIWSEILVKFKKQAINMCTYVWIITVISVYNSFRGVLQLNHWIINV